MRRLRIIGTLGEIYTLDNQPVTSELWDSLIKRIENSNKTFNLELQEQYSDEAIFGDSQSEKTIKWDTIAQFKTQN